MTIPAASNPSILLTGFEPFDGAASNSSWDAVELVAQRWTGTEHLTIERLPVTFAGAGNSIIELIARYRPDLVICVGLANGRASVTPERIAVNLEDARIPDNLGDEPSERAILPHGPSAYWSGLPVKAIAAAISEAGIPGAVSDTAGTYVCNSLMYRLMDAVAGTQTRAGFIHVPCSPSLADGTDQPYLAIEDIATALEVAIRVSL